MTNLSKHLRNEAQKYGSIRKFQAAVSEKLNRRGGSSYRYVHEYLRGKRIPSDVFLQAAAEVLGVRIEWLQRGEGPRTEREGLTDEQLFRNYMDSHRPKSWTEVALSPDRWVRDALGDLADNLPSHAIVSIQSFVEEVYRTLGPEAFGAEEIGAWRPGAGYSEGLSVEESEFRAFVAKRFTNLEDLWEEAPRWEKAAAVHSLLATLYICEFGGART